MNPTQRIIYVDQPGLIFPSSVYRDGSDELKNAYIKFVSDSALLFDDTLSSDELETAAEAMFDLESVLAEVERLSRHKKIWVHKCWFSIYPRVVLGPRRRQARVRAHVQRDDHRAVEGRLPQS
jgi:hypothetical protein